MTEYVYFGVPLLSSLYCVRDFLYDTVVMLEVFSLKEVARDGFVVTEVDPMFTQLFIR